MKGTASGKGVYFHENEGSGFRKSNLFSCKYEGNGFKKSSLFSAASGKAVCGRFEL